ncbi:MAG: SIMPL domain-containing protein [Lachnospiraceae bacterium]|nr:SIMPL domain-containing protein [Lachnospiraceae bacterium]
MKSSIKIMGFARGKVKANIVKFKMDINGRCDIYKDAVEQSLNRSAAMLVVLKGLGIEEENIIARKYEISRMTKTLWKQGDETEEFLGYGYTRRIEVKFPAETENLEFIASKILQCGVADKFYVEFYAENKKSEENELLKLAIKDSKEKAKIAAEQLNVTLGDMVQVEFEWSNGIKSMQRRWGETMLDIETVEQIQLDNSSIFLLGEEIEIEQMVRIVWNLISTEGENESILCGEMV